jgi:hypothetical protein
MIDTHATPHCGDLEAGLASIAYWRLDPCDPCRWQAADADEFCRGSDAAMPTTVVVQGYNDDADESVRRGWELLCEMRQYAAGKPFRLVVWSWPADRCGCGLRGLHADLQLKAALSDMEGYYLARVLLDTKPGTPLSFIGYSYGVRVVGGALELLAQGEVAGRRLDTELAAAWARQPRRVRAVFLAAAADCDALEPGGAYGRAPAVAEKILVTRDCLDRALRLYPRLYGRGGPQALGHTGPCAAGENVEVLDVTCAVGKSHDWNCYDAATLTDQRLGWYTFLVD